MSARLPTTLLAIAALGMSAGVVHAQIQSESYKFLQAVRGEKNAEVVEMLSKPGSTVINTRDISSGEGALHIVVKRGDLMYLRFLLGRGADANAKDGQGNTPLILAATGGQAELVDVLLAVKANVNLGNSSGETPLIRAVQRRDLTMARTLIAAGADPDQGDLLAGMSARDYAREDKRSPAIAKLLEETPKKARKAVSGPKF